MVAHSIVGIGDTVNFLMGTTPLTGTVVEDRGPIGKDGTHIYRISVPDDPYEETSYVMPATGLSKAENHTVLPTVPEMKDFFIEGGLLSLLRRNRGGSNQPIAWLTRDSHNNLTFTFHADRGLVGGHTIPFWADEGDKVFKPKTPDVIEYITTFGLKTEDAEEIVRKVGTTA